MDNDHFIVGQCELGAYSRARERIQSETVCVDAVRNDRERTRYKTKCAVHVASSEGIGHDSVWPGGAFRARVDGPPQRTAVVAPFHIGIAYSPIQACRGALT